MIRQLLAAIAIAIIASLKPAWSLLELYRLPVGTELRPMHLGMELFFFGFGTPVLVGTIVVFALVRASFPYQDRTARHLLFPWFLSRAAVALSLVPLCLLVFGVRWVVDARDLYFKP